MEFAWERQDRQGYSMIIQVVPCTRVTGGEGEWELKLCLCSAHKPCALLAQGFIDWRKDFLYFR